jgi:hypothetical protein
VDPTLLIFFFSDPDPTLTLISDPLKKICTFLDLDCLVKLILTADHLNIAKANFF